MKRLSTTLIVVAAACATLMPAPSFPQSSGAGPATAEPGNFSTLSCADFINAAGIAVPPKKATAAQQRRAEGAQDAIAAAMVWLHGYLTGRGTPNLGEMSRAWLQDTVARVSRECKAAPQPAQLLLVDVVSRP